MHRRSQALTQSLSAAEDQLSAHHGLTDMLPVQYFAKCGIIKEDEERQPRIKIYRDKASGFAKGDGLVTYLKEPSVRLTICWSCPWCHLDGR